MRFRSYLLVRAETIKDSSPVCSLLLATTAAEYNSPGINFFAVNVLSIIAFDLLATSLDEFLTVTMNDTSVSFVLHLITNSVSGSSVSWPISTSAGVSGSKIPP